MDTISIGTKIEYKGNTLEIVEACDTKNPCKRCFFDLSLDCYEDADLIGYCGCE